MNRRKKPVALRTRLLPAQTCRAGMLGLFLLIILPAAAVPEAAPPPDSCRVLFLVRSVELPPWNLAMFSECRTEFERLTGRPVSMMIESLAGNGPALPLSTRSEGIQFMVYRNPLSTVPLRLAEETGIPLVVPTCDTAWMPDADVLPPNVYLRTVTLSPDRTARLARQLCPWIRKLIVIAGDHDTDRFFIRRAREQLGETFDGLAIEYWEGVAPAELNKRVATLPADHAILFLKMTQDPSGAIHISSDIVRDLAACSPVPIFGVSDTFVESGILGGYVASSRIEGRRAAQMLTRLAAGEALPAIEHVVDYGEYQFNWNEMKRWGIRERRLPEGARILYRPDRLFDRHIWIPSALRTLTALLFLALGIALWIQHRRKPIKEALKKSGERFRSFMAHTDEGLYLFEAHEPIPTDLPAREQIRRIYATKIVECNDAQAHMYGFDRASEVVGKTLEELHGSTDNPDNIRFMTDWIENGYRSTGGISEERDRNGNPVWFSNNVFGVIENNRLVRIWGTQKDITEQKQARDAERIAHDTLRQLVESTPAGVVMADCSGQITVANQTALQLLGGRVSGDASGPSGGYELLNPDGTPVPGSELPLPRAIHNGESSRDVELLVSRTDGTEVYMLVSATPLRSASGESLGAVGVMLDITDRKQAENQARLMAELVKNSDQPVAIGFADGRLGQFNPAFCALTGYTEEELQALDWAADLTPPEWLTQERTILAELERTGAPARYRKEYIRKDGSRVPIELFAHLARKADGSPDYFYAFITDITERKQAQKRLQLVNDALENALNGFEIVNQDRRFTYVNRSYIEMWGYDRAEEILGTSPAEHCRDPEQPGRIIQELETTGSYEGEFTAKRKDGSTFEVLMVARRTYDAENNVIYTGSSIDITARKRAEEALRRERSLLKEAQKIAHLGIFEYIAATQTLVWSDEEYRIFGLDPAAPAPSYEKMLAEYIHPDDADELHRIFMEAMQSQTVYEQEHRIVRPDGQVRWVYNRATPHFNAHGELVRYIGITLDTTERKRAEQQLRTESSMLQLALQASQTGAWYLNLDDHSAHRTPGHDQIFGYPEPLSEWTYEMFLDHVLPEDRETVDRKFQEATATESDWSFECRIRRPDGNVRWIWSVGRHDITRDRSMHIMVGVIQDITERKRTAQELKKSYDLLETRVEERTAELQTRTAEAETLNRAMINLLEDLKETNLELEHTERSLRATNKELEAFSYSVSHDLRAPLRHIDGFVRLLLKRECEHLDDTSTRYLDTIAQSSDRMGRLIDDLLAFSRTGRTDMRLAPVDSNQLVQDVIQELGDLTADRRVVWQVADLPAARADRSLLRQVWANLIENAVKYSGPRNEARIEIGTTRKGCAADADDTAFFIRDNGVGFDPQYSDKLFGVFQRLHRADEFEGTGIGLATVQRIVHRHGGRVWAEAAVDQGATFYFTLENAGDTE